MGMKNELDFDKYKSSLKNYLSAKGFDVSLNPMFCFSPEHNNTDSPAMQIHEDGFKCHGCGAFGDIYDAAGLICGISDVAERFKEVEKTLGFSSSISSGAIKKAPEHKIDPESVELFEAYLRSHGGRKAGVSAFLKERGYPVQIATAMINKFGYWPGLDEASKAIPLETLNKAGIPIPTEEKNYSAWYHSGVVIKLGTGYKLMWYGNDKKNNYGCQKRNSLSAKTFPCPRPTEDNLSGTIILTEAETSALSMRAAGFENVYSAGGTNGITSFNAPLLKDCENIIFAFDGDNAGRYFSGLDEYKIDKKTGEKSTPKTAVQKIITAGYKGRIHTARLEENSDPDDFLQAGRIEELRKIIADAVEINVSNVPTEPEKKTITGEIEPPFQFLGYDERCYHILPMTQNIVLKINRGDTSIKNWMHEGAEEDWWMENFNTEVETKEGEVKTVFDKKTALTWFRNESYKAGIFDEKRMKGVGAHFDGDKILLNTGRNIKICGNGSLEYKDWEGRDFYIRSRRHFKLTKKEWGIEDGRNLWKQINTFNFEKKMDKIAIAGYMVMSPFASLLFRRPSIWITAMKGTGKSYLMENLIVPACGGADYTFFSEGLSSEAFIRQSLKKDSVPVIIDEFEGKNKQENLNNTKVLNLMRSAYGGKMIGKGSSDHNPIEFSVMSMFCFGSINVKLDNDGDRTRMHVCRMKESKGICQAPEDFDGMRARTFNMMPKILKDIKACKAALLDFGLNDRMSDTYSPFLAGTWNLVSDKPYMTGDDEKIISFFGDAIEELLGKDSVDDEDRIIERILQNRIRVDSSIEKTVAEMLTERAGTRTAIEPLLYNDFLQRYGIKRLKKRTTGQEVIAFALDSAALSKMLEDTPFADYKEIMQRNKCLVDKNFPTRFAGSQSRAVLLDWKKFEDEYMGEEEKQEIDKSEDLPEFN